MRGQRLVASHDRAFLDSVAHRILELNVGVSGLTSYPGNYSDYRLIKGRELEKQTAAWKDQEAEKKRQRQEIAQKKQVALRTENSTTHDFYRARAKKVARRAKAQESRLKRMLSSSDLVERPKKAATMKLDFGRMPRGGSRVLMLENAGHSFGGPWLFRNVDLVLEHGERVALLGPNGCGKSTLLEMVAGNMTPAAGSVRIGANVKVGYMPQDQTGLDWSISAMDMVRRAVDVTETEARTMLHLYLFEKGRTAASRAQPELRSTVQADACKARA